MKQYTETMSETSSPHPGQCPWCPARYSTVSELARHLKATREHLLERLRESEKLRDGLADRLYHADRDLRTMTETLTAAQQRGTELVEENRILRARLARYGDT